jgi:hypothetical protein
MVFACPTNNEMGKACRTHGSDENACKILLENVKGRDYLEDLDVDGSILFK